MYSKDPRLKHLPRIIQHTNKILDASAYGEKELDPSSHEFGSVLNSITAIGQHVKQLRDSMGDEGRPSGVAPDNWKKISGMRDWICHDEELLGQKVVNIVATTYISKLRTACLAELAIISPTAMQTFNPISFPTYKP